MKKMKKIKLIPALKKHFSYFFLKKKLKKQASKKNSEEMKKFSLHLLFSSVCVYLRDDFPLLCSRNDDENSHVV